MWWGNCNMGKNIKFYISKALRKYLNPPAIRDSQLDPTVAIWDNCIISNSTIGRYTYVSDHSRISHTRIGSFCSIGTLCQIGGASHPMEFVSTSPLFYKGRNAFGRHIANNEFIEYENTKIGNDVWIGATCLIKSGVQISDGAVIGMGSVVTKSIGPYEIWAGNPARLIRKRFDDKTIEKLLEIRWWDWPEEKLQKYGKYFNKPEVLFDALERNCK